MVQASDSTRNAAVEAAGGSGSGRSPRQNQPCSCRQLHSPACALRRAHASLHGPFHSFPYAGAPHETDVFAVDAMFDKARAGCPVLSVIPLYILHPVVVFGEGKTRLSS